MKSIRNVATVLPLSLFAGIALGGPQSDFDERL